MGDVMKFNLGETVKCKITEMEGKVSQLSKHIYSQNRYCIQPPYNKKDMKMPHSCYIDEVSLESLKVSELENLYQYEDGEFALGDKVRDTLHEVEGKIVERSLCLNGCYRVKITCKSEKDGDAISYWCEEKSLILVKSVKDSETKPASRTTGSVMEEVPWTN